MRALAQSHRERELLGGVPSWRGSRSTRSATVYDGRRARRGPGRGVRAVGADRPRRVQPPRRHGASVAVSYGPVPGEIYAGHRFIDVLIHGWDVAKATNPRSHVSLDPALSGVLGIVTLEPQLSRRAACSGRREVPSAATSRSRPVRGHAGPSAGVPWAGGGRASPRKPGYSPGAETGPSAGREEKSIDTDFHSLNSSSAWGPASRKPLPVVLHPAEGQLHLGADGRRVHVDDAELELGDGAHGRGHVVGVDRCRQAELRRVGRGDGFVEVGDRYDRGHRAEDLLLGDAHVRAWHR